MKQVKYAVIGLGFFGKIHSEILSGMPDVDLVAVCTRRPHRLKEVADQLEVPKTYTDYRDLLKDPEIDAVHVVTKFHKEITIDSLKAGKHVFVEKPMAHTVEECDAIIKAGKSANGFLMVGHVCRFDPRVTLAKEAVDEGRIGRIVSMHATRNLSKTASNLTPQILDSFSTLMGEGIHDVDVMLWMNKNKITKAYTQTVPIREYKYPDISWAMLHFDNGAIGVIENVRYLPETTPYGIDARMEIIGTEGAIYINAGEGGLTINDSDGMRKPDTGYWPMVHGKRIGVLRNEFSYFAECIRNEKHPEVITPEEAREAVKAVCAAEKSSETGEAVKIS